MKRKVAFYVSLALFAVALCALAVYIWLNFFPSAETVVPEQPAESSSATQTSSVVLGDNPVDFATLQADNSDICGWIKIPGTAVDYAVLRSGDEPEDFYLDHNTAKKYEFAGSIYMQKLNLPDFSDRNVVLYGHNMKNGSMFASLLKYRDRAFFDANRVIYIYRPGHILTYTIFSAYRYDNRHLLYSFNFDDTVVYADYLTMATHPKSAIVNTHDDVPVTVNDRIITLSTCITGDDYRYLVQGVLTSDQPTG